MASARRILYTPPGHAVPHERRRPPVGCGTVRGAQRSSETNYLMSNSIILLPFIVAFLGFAFRFYVRESAASMVNPSFLMAVGTVLAVVLYLVLGVLEILPAYS